MTEWIKPNGSTIELNASKATTEHAISLGWKLAKKAKKAKTSRKASAVTNDNSSTGN